MFWWGCAGGCRGKLLFAPTLLSLACQAGVEGISGPAVRNGVADQRTTCLHTSDHGPFPPADPSLCQVLKCKVSLLPLLPPWHAHFVSNSRSLSITSHGNARQDIFLHDADRRTFLDTYLSQLHRRSNERSRHVTGLTGAPQPSPTLLQVLFFSL